MKITVRIAVLAFWVDCAPVQFGAILGRWVAVGRNPEPIGLNCVRIALYLQSIHNPEDCARIAKSPRTRSTRIPRIAKDCAGIASVLGDRVLTPDRSRSDANCGAIGDV